MPELWAIAAALIGSVGQGNLSLQPGPTAVLSQGQPPNRAFQPPNRPLNRVVEVVCCASIQPSLSDT